MRPRFGVMRSREFLMKMLTLSILPRNPCRKPTMHDAAYSKIFSRMGLDFRAVQAIPVLLAVAPSPISGAGAER
ncbi:hypothetical protein ACLK2I_01125 [Escherichia coli]